MGLDTGENAGIGGIVDFGGAGKFRVRVYEWADSTKLRMIENTGEGSAGQSSFRAENESGTILLMGKVLREGYPVPTVIANAIGTLAIQYDYTGPVSKSQSVQVQSVKFNYDQKDKSNWSFEIVCSRVGAVTWTGWPGTQPTQSAPSPGVSYLYDGRSKTYDSNGLVDISTKAIDFWGITADTDAGEVIQIAAIVAAYTTPPQTGEKLYTAALIRTGYTGGRVTLTWRKRDSKDDVEMPETWNIVDGNNIASTASSAVLDGSPSLPPGFVARGTREQYLNDDHVLRVSQGGLRSTVEDVEFPGTWTWTDVSSLDGRGQQVTVYVTTNGVPADPTPPTGLQIVESKIDQINRVMSAKTWIFGVNTNKQKIEFGGTVTAIDANVLRDSSEVTLETSSATPPSTPAAPVGKLALGPITKQLTPTKWAHTWKYADRDSKDDIEMPGTTRSIDPSNLETAAQNAVVSGSSFASIPADLVVVSTDYVRENDNKIVTRTRYGVQTNEQRIENAGTNSSRSSLDPYTDVDCQVSSCLSSDTAAALSNTAWAIYQGIGFVDRISVEKLTPLRLRLLVFYVNPGIEVSGDGEAGDQWVLARLNSGNAQLYLQSNRSRGTGVRRIQFSAAQTKSRTVRRFSIRRFLSGTTIPEQSPSTIGGTTMPSYGNANSASFLGLSAGTCYYAFAQYRTNLSLAGTLVFEMRYFFVADTNGFFDQIAAKLFDAPSTLTTSTTGAGWQNVSGLGLPSGSITEVTRASFAAFVA